MKLLCNSQHCFRRGIVQLFSDLFVEQIPLLQLTTEIFHLFLFSQREKKVLISRGFFLKASPLKKKKNTSPLLALLP